MLECIVANESLQLLIRISHEEVTDYERADPKSLDLRLAYEPETALRKTKHRSREPTAAFPAKPAASITAFDSYDEDATFQTYLLTS